MSNALYFNEFFNVILSSKKYLSNDRVYFAKNRINIKKGYEKDGKKKQHQPAQLLAYAGVVEGDHKGPSEKEGNQVNVNGFEDMGPGPTGGANHPPGKCLGMLDWKGWMWHDHGPRSLSE